MYGGCVAIFNARSINLVVLSYCAQLELGAADKSLRPLEPGRLMAQHYISFVTMRAMVATPPHANLPALLMQLANSAELSEIRLRRCACFVSSTGVYGQYHTVSQWVGRVCLPVCRLAASCAGILPAAAPVPPCSCRCITVQCSMRWHVLTAKQTRKLGKPLVT